MEKPQERFMRLAIEEARRGVNEAEGGPFGAVIVKDGIVLGMAHNTVLKSNDPTRHAEVNAISLVSKRVGNYDLSGCEIYSTTEPCPMCFSAIHWARIKKLVFGTRIEDVWELGFNEMPIHSEKMKELGGSPMEIESGFIREECLELLRYWNGLSTKKVY